MNFVSIFIASPIVRLFLLYLTIISLEMLKCIPLGYKILHPSKNLADVLWGQGQLWGNVWPRGGTPAAAVKEGHMKKTCPEQGASHGRWGTRTWNNGCIH
jgi:hypothetical protein